MTRGLHKTDIEVIMQTALKENKIEFVEEYPIRCKYGYIVDFFLPEYNMIVECDGERWHKEGNSHDRKRDKFLEKKGYIILRFKGEEIRNNVQECIKKIFIEMKGGKK